MTNLFESIRSALGAIASSVLTTQMKPEIDLSYPPQHPLAGLPMGKLLLEIGEKGGAGYKHFIEPLQRKAPLLDIVEPLAVRMAFDSLPSALGYVRANEPAARAEVFVHAADYEPAHVMGYLDARRPRLGQVTMELARHPVWDRFDDIFAEVRDSPVGWVSLPHETLADLLLENTEFLAVPDVALLIARFHGARRVTYEANLDTERTQGVRIEWKGASTDDKGAPVALPREFEMNIPAHVGAWEPGQEPLITARFALRVIGREDAAPVFKLCWSNRAEYELAARAALKAGVDAMVAAAFAGADRQPPVYLAKPDIRRVAAPNVVL